MNGWLEPYDDKKLAPANGFIPLMVPHHTLSKMQYVSATKTAIPELDCTSTAGDAPIQTMSNDNNCQTCYDLLWITISKRTPV